MTPRFAMRYISEDENSNGNENSAIMQDLPHLTQFVHNRHLKRHIALYNHCRGIEDVKGQPSSRGSNPRPCALQMRFPTFDDLCTLIPFFIENKECLLNSSRPWLNTMLDGSTCPGSKMSCFYL